MWSKKFTSKQVLEILGQVVEESIPEDMQGSLTLEWTEDDGVEAIFVEDASSMVAN